MRADVPDVIDPPVCNGCLDALPRIRAILDAVARISRGEIVDLAEPAAFQGVHRTCRPPAIEIADIHALMIAAAIGESVMTDRNGKPDIVSS